jgi:cell division protein FtsW
MSSQGRFDTPLLVLTLILVVVGLLMVSSASATGLKKEGANPSTYVIKEFVQIGIGLFALLLAIHLDYRFWFRFLTPLLAILTGFLVYLLVRGVPTGGSALTASRWVDLGPASFQPSVGVAFLTVLLWAKAATRGTEQGQNRTFFPYIPTFLVTCVFALLIYKEPDLGTAVILVVTAFVMMFLAGAPFLPMAGFSAVVGCFGLLSMLSTPWRRERLAAWINPWDHADGAGYQIVHSLFAFARGGLTGVGLAQGKEKALYLPECHTDFIFAVVGEEFGLLGSLSVLALFGLFLWRGFTIASRQRESLAYYTAMGITSLFCIQTTINLMVVTNLLPTKGLTLPFLSYGGTSMVFSLWAVGILLQLSQRGREAAR